MGLGSFPILCTCTKIFIIFTPVQSAEVFKQVKDKSIFVEPLADKYGDPDGNEKTFSNYFEGQNMDNYPLLQLKSSPIISKGKIRMIVPKDGEQK